MVAAVVTLATTACGGVDDFTDRTAEVRVGGASATYEVESCGLDDQTVFLVARAPDGAVLQLVMDLEEDDESAVLSATGLTIDQRPDDPGSRVAAFGAVAWERRSGPGSPPGAITSAALRGSRVQVEGSAVPVDEADRRITGGDATAVSVDARCDGAGDADLTT